jgi:predicted porin
MKKLALASMVAAAAAVAAPAQAVTVMAEDGWTLGVSGQVNQFAVFTDNDSGDDIQEVRDGLLPAFINFDMKAPTMNGLDLAAHISFSPGTNQSSYAAFEQREVYFTVDGSFGQVLMGKALGLYGSHNILTEQTLWGVGYGTGGNGGTTLGGIGLGYDYAAWRSQIRYTTPDMNGFKAAFAVVDSSQSSFRFAGNGGLPISSLNTGSAFPTGDGLAEDSDDFRYEGDLSYAGAFDGGSYSLWLSAAIEDRDELNEDLQQWTAGGTLKVGGFEFMAQYSDSEDGTADLVRDPTGELEWDQYVIQAGYRFNGTTLVSANYSELEDKSAAAVDGADESERITLGIYHDVNSNLKLVAEYTKVENDNEDNLDQDIFAIGGFMFF